MSVPYQPNFQGQPLQDFEQNRIEKELKEKKKRNITIIIVVISFLITGIILILVLYKPGNGSQNDLTDGTVQNPGTLVPTPTPLPAPAPTVCTDIPPDGNYTCDLQAAWGKCNEPWMAGFCMKSCNKCPA